MVVILYYSHVIIRVDKSKISDESCFFCCLKKQLRKKQSKTRYIFSENHDKHRNDNTEHKHRFDTKVSDLFFALNGGF